MKKPYAIISLFILIYCLTGCAQSSDKCVQADIPYQLKDISMRDENKGWALTTENEILFTDSGIENFVPAWKFDDVSGDGGYFVDVCFVDEQNVYAAYFSENRDLEVEYTKDGGESWQQTLVAKWEDSSEEMPMDAGGRAYISFSDAENGYLLYCTSPAMSMMMKFLFYTTDAGESFSYAGEISEISGYPQGIDVSAGKCFIAVSPRAEEHYMYVREDNAEKWKSEEIITLPEERRYIDGLTPVFDMEDKQKGMMVLKAVGDDMSYLLLVTEDGGESWVQYGEIPLDSVEKYSCIDGNEFYLIDNTGNLYKYF